MFKKTLISTIAIALAAGLSVAGITACDAPEEPDQAVTEQEASAADEAAAELAAEEPSEPGAAGEPQFGEPGDQEVALEQGAQDRGGQPADPMANQPPPIEGEISDAQLDDFAEAVEATVEFQQNQDIQARMQDVGSPEEMEQVQEEFMSELQTEIESTGIDFDEYIGMAQRMEMDPELQQRFAERMGTPEQLQQQ